MKPYYKDDLVTVYHGDASQIRPELGIDAVTITDPPYNVGYHYNEYRDNMKESEYIHLLCKCITKPAVVIHYPEEMFLVSIALDAMPDKCVAWTYNANTPRQWRMVAWFGCQPDFSLVKQPYRNQSDKRIMALVEEGSQGTNLYDWWHEEQVKNVSSEKTDHPCQIPEAVMNKIVRITNPGIVIDPFCGSGTTLVACKNSGIPSIGIELSEEYCEIAAGRCSQEVLKL